MVFSTVGYPQKTLLEEIKKEVGDVPMVGCSGSGVIAPSVADESNHCVAVLAMADPRIHLHTSGYPDVTGSSDAGRIVGEALGRNFRDDARCVLLFSCGLDTLVDDLVPEIEKNIGHELPIIGGLAADNLLRDKTYQYHDWEVYEGGISAALMSGDFDLITDVSHGCVPIGLEMEVTKVDANRVYEIDDRPVLDVMIECVGDGIVRDFGKAALHFCIGQQSDPDLIEYYDKYSIRYIAKLYPEDGSISLPVKMKKGDKIWLTRRDRDKMFAACHSSINKLQKKIEEKSPFLVLDINCVGRGKIVLADKEKNDLLSSFQTRLAPGIPWIGFFSYGEFCPVEKRNTFHNYTEVLALFVWR
ncbi:MAG: FIST C-terminal domain-containing protein [Deltaproteobacteria bacterium]|nr:FIST C-terminal domain-containing protein [Deltaproteobacteria bacterium]